MKCGGKTLIWLLCFMALDSRSAVNDTAPAPSENGGRPYSAIWLRNVFDLKPAPPPVLEAPKPATPPPNVHLTGITTILGKARALFLVQEQALPGKPAPKEESYMLREGERQGPLEVVEINPAARTVKINLEGNVSTVTFETNRPSSGPGNGGGPQGRPAQPPPGFNPGFNPGNGAIPNRPVRTPNFSSFTPQGNSGQPQTFNGQAVASSGGLAYNQNSPSPASSTPAMSAEEQAIMMAAQRTQMASQIAAGTFPPFPPIPGIDPPPVPGTSTISGAATPSATESSGNENQPTVPQFGRRASGTMAVPPTP